MSDAENQRHEQNVAAGLKASINNPRVSDEAKERAAQHLDEMGVTAESGGSERRTRSSDDTEETEQDATGEEEDQDSHDAEVHKHRVIGGYKATLKNPRVSEEAKEKARKELDAYGEEYDD
ncbi:hypothetical protein D9619_003754 [Psilocybe cf. subviscida]|uniref:Conidiation protein 6 n=1 Tax=Psilocybe cf. subviscida TaxID=2480587 RepID=A0A8H5EU80_9AGAR|nr:hypothetical protein D9619_003754 [Psilocybe cf. subviscida]